MKEVEVVIEVRDARIPISSQNQRFEHMLCQKERIVVYNKSDLSDSLQNKVRIINSFFIMKKLDRITGKLPFVVTNGHVESTTISILNILKERLKPNDRIMVVGISNVGKSTIINGMRHKGVPHTKGRSAAVGRNAGVTRSVSGLIRVLEEPKVYCYDSPGIMLPSCSDTESLLKIAVTGGVHDDAILIDDVAHYLFHLLQQRGINEHFKIYELDSSKSTLDVHQFIKELCHKIPGGIYPQSGKMNLDLIHRRFLRDFRLGKFGRLTLDEF